MSVINKFTNMKIGQKLNASFLILALLVALTGYIGYTSVKNVGASGDFILDEKVPIADASMESTILAVAGRDAMGEYLLHDDPEDLKAIRAEFQGMEAEFDMWYDAMVLGTENDAFKGSESGALWISTGHGDEQIFAVDASSETAERLKIVRSEFNEFSAAAHNLMAVHDTALEAEPKAGEAMEEMDAAGGLMLAKATESSFSNDDMNTIWEQLMTGNDYLITGDQAEVDAFYSVKAEIESLSNYPAIETEHQEVVAGGEELISHYQDYLKYTAAGDDDAALEAYAKAGEAMEEMDAAGGLMLAKATESSFSSDDINLIWEQLMTGNDYLITGDQAEVDAFYSVKAEVESLPNYPAIEAEHKATVAGGEKLISLHLEYLGYVDEEMVQMGIVDVTSSQVDDEMSNVEEAAGAEMAAAMLAADATQSRSTKIALIVTALAVAFALIIGQVLTRGITTPIKKIVDDANRVAEGDLGHRIEESDSKDEIGELTNALAQMVRNTAEPVKQLGVASKAIAQGDLTVRLDIESKGDIADLIVSFGDMENSLQNLVSKVQTTAAFVTTQSNDLASVSEEMNASTEEISATVTQMANGAQDQSKQSQEASASMQNMTTLIKQVTVSAQEAAQTSNKANETAQQGGAVIKDSAQVVKDLDERSQQIVEIVSVITSIADQTNLLALNAAIEAARAGEHGRGFAVVAEEVRKLAEESGQAADKIADLIKAIQGETGRASESMDTALASLEEIVQSVNDTATKVQEISVAMDEQGLEVEKVANAIDGIAAAAEEAASSAEETSASTEEQTASMQQMSASAQELSTQAEGLQREVSKFKLSNGHESISFQQPVEPEPQERLAKDEKVTSVTVEGNGKGNGEHEEKAAPAKAAGAGRKSKRVEKPPSH